MTLDETDKKILTLLQDDFPLVSRPFLGASEKLGIPEDRIIDRVKKMMESGILRRFSAAIRHRRLGITANPMCAFKVSQERVEEVGEKLASFDEVTHCYERPIVPGKWEYNVFAMVHGYDRDEVEKTVEKIASEVGIEDYKLLYSTREFKKTYKRYVE
jgi:DNA-binding Lrp family transcriptional regulator